MDAIELLQQQLRTAHGVLRATIAEIGSSEWNAAPFRDANPPGFLAWHMVATQDWALHTWLRGVPDVRSHLGLPGVDPPHGPFGMTSAEAAAIGRGASPAEIEQYADAVLASGLEWIQTLAPPDLDGVQPTREYVRRVPVSHKSAAYLAEIDDMYDLPVWRIISGPCFGHLRGHAGEIGAVLAILRAS